MPIHNSTRAPGISVVQNLKSHLTSRDHTAVILVRHLRVFMLALVLKTVYVARRIRATIVVGTS